MKDYKKNMTISVYTALYTFTILIPCIISVMAGVHKTDLFCEKNHGLCNEYSGSINMTLPQQLEKTTKAVSLALSLSSALVPGIISMLFIAITQFLSERPQSKEDAKSERTPILPYHYNRNGCCGLFKKFKAQVTQSDLCLLPIIVVTAIGTCALISWITGIVARDTICSNVISLTNLTNSTNSTNFAGFMHLANFSNHTNCTRYFPNATIDELQKLSQLANNVYGTILKLGAILGTVSSLLSAVMTLGISACVKHRLDIAAEEEINARDVYSL